MESEIRVVNPGSVDEGAVVSIPIGLLKREAGVFLCLWGMLQGWHAAESLNNPILTGTWGFALFLAFGAEFSGAFDGKRNRIALAIAGGISVLLALLAARFHERLFFHLDQVFAVVAGASPSGNWALLSIFLGILIIGGRLLARLPVDASRYFRLLPLALLVFLFFKNKVLGS